MTRHALITAAFFVMAGLLFARLGHYALWDDEAITALGAKAVMQTGDASVLLDHGNIVGYRNGVNITKFHDRLDPPLPTYLTAASFTLLGMDAWTARLPFALLGLATAALVLFWARRESWPVLAVLLFGLLTNVSLILFFRQCRYYGAAIFFSTAIAFVYWRWKPTARNLLILAGLSILLFVSNYMNYCALYLCLGIDYLLWRRKEAPLTWRQILLLLGPQLIVNGAIFSIWNPLKTAFGGYEAMNNFWDRLTLFYWYWRDMDRSEFIAFPLFLLVLGVGLAQRRVWLIRGAVAMIVYVAALSLVSPQPVRQSLEGEVRYLSPLILLAVALQTGALCALLERRKVLLGITAAVAFGTNLLNGGPFLNWGLRSSILSYLGELSLPQTEPYTPAEQWVNDHVPEGASVWVTPYYATYPLMFHAPKALYAWQLSWPPRPDFAGLPRIHFMGQEPPDYVIAFGPYVNQVMPEIGNLNRPDITYQRVDTLNVFWRDTYRPELYWHTFESNTSFNPNSEAIYIFQRVKTPAPAPGKQNSSPTSHL